MQAIPQRIADLQYINSIQGYKGNIHKLGRILKHVSIGRNYVKMKHLDY